MWTFVYKEVASCQFIQVCLCLTTLKLSSKWEKLNHQYIGGR